MSRTPKAQGLYDPRNEHDACGVGFVADVKGRKSHGIVQEGLQILLNLDHRGAVGADPLAGDGAGILCQLPDSFFRAINLGFELPAEGSYAVGQVFLPQDAAARTAIEALLEGCAVGEGLVVLGWRDVPVHADGLGYSVKAVEPNVRQFFVSRIGTTLDQDSFERKCFVVRKLAEIKVMNDQMAGEGDFYL